MYSLAGTDRPWARRLDHLICEVPDIERAYALLLGLGFPSAWPVGRFWPTGRTAGVALGGVNLELLEPDVGAPAVARIGTLAFEPVSLEVAAHGLADLGVTVEIMEKWEADPHLLRLRGFDGREAEFRQLICRNAYSRGALPFSFFFCEYAPSLRARLSPAAFPDLPPVTQIMLATPDPAGDWRRIDRMFGLPASGRNVEIVLREEPNPSPEVVEILTDQGPIPLWG